MRSFERYCKDFYNIENYEKAKSDNFVGWECHHRLETHTSDGERRNVDLLAKELKALDMYYNRPASELIFMTNSDHHKLHNNLCKSGFSTRFKKGHKPHNKGKHLSEEQRLTISIKTKEAMKSIDMSSKLIAFYKSLSPEQLEEHKRKIGNHKVYCGDANPSRRPDVKLNIGDKRRNAAKAYRKYKENGGTLCWNDFNRVYKDNINDFL